MKRDFWKDLDVAASFAKDNYISWWNNFKCESKFYLYLYYKDDSCLTFRLTDYESRYSDDPDVIFELDIGENDVDVDLYQELTNKLKKIEIK